MEYIAHVRQTLEEHLQGVSELTKIHAKKIGMENYGELLGLLHDFGKYSADFQKYITDAIKKNDPQFNPDEDEDFEDPTGKKEKLTTPLLGPSFFLTKTDHPMPIKYLGSFSPCVWFHITQD